MEKSKSVSSFYPHLADIKTREIEPNGQAVKNPPCPLADKTD